MHLLRASFFLGTCLLAATTSPSVWQLGPFSRPKHAQPVITPRPTSTFACPLRHAPVHWEALHTFNPAAIVREGKVYVLYRAEDDSGDMAIGGHTSRLGLAVSDDGLHFTRDPEPVLYPADDDQKAREWEGGVEDPRIVESEDGLYVVTYTQWNRATYDAGVATSRDLRHWTKHGPALARAYGGKYANLKYKSAAIVTKLLNGRLLAARIHGKYWMYWGEGRISLATSDNLIDWAPVEDARGEPVALLEKRAGRFDSFLPEVGPPPVVTSRGIVMIYNGKNADQNGAPGLPGSTYAAGQALFSADDPAQLLDRADTPFFKPELPWERSGQYVAGTTFAEGLVFFHNRWMLYYGCADSLVGVAMTRP
ncbi:MAG TPA: pesticidal protein Cry15Aa [Solibacterales bacterium]|nr:pesticidal protein Cry15Aa [Bryobacterales bacterium]